MTAMRWFLYIQQQYEYMGHIHNTAYNTKFAVLLAHKNQMRLQFASET